MTDRLRRAIAADAEAEPLAGGNASGAVRIGDTVRKPWTPTTGRVAALMETIRAAGVDVPRHRGRDGVGRQVLEWIPGESAMTVGLDDAGLARVGGIVRAIHDASPGYDPVDGTWDVLLPAENQHVATRFDSYDQVVDAFEQIVPGRTDTGALARIGFDPRTGNVDVLSYLDVEKRFLP